MRFLTRSLTGLAITALTFGLLFLGLLTLWQAVESRRAGPDRARMAGEQVYTVAMMRLAAGPVDPVLAVYGTLQSRRELQLRAGAAGRIVALADAMHEGGAARAGDVLVRIDPAPAQAALDTARAAHDEAAAKLAEALAAVDIARDDLTAAQDQAALREAAADRQKTLASRGLGTSSEGEAAALALSGANQAVLNRRNALANAEGAVNTARVALRRAEITRSEAERSLRDTRVIAGFDGRLTAITAIEGGLVGPNEQLGLLIDPDALEVQIPLSLDQFARLIAGGGGVDGTPVTVTLDGADGRIEAPAIIDRAAASVAAGTAGRVVYARLTTPDARLRPGDFVTARITEPRLDAAATIPAPALGADGTVLVVGADDRLTARVVQVLRRQGNDLIIAVPDDLDGAAIVTTRAPWLGVGVRVRDAATPAPDPAPRGGGGGGGGGGGRGQQGGGQNATPQDTPPNATPSPAATADRPAAGQGAGKATPPATQGPPAQTPTPRTTGSATPAPATVPAQAAAPGVTAPATAQVQTDPARQAANARLDRAAGQARANATPAPATVPTDEADQAAAPGVTVPATAPAQTDAARRAATATHRVDGQVRQGGVLRAPSGRADRAVCLATTTPATAPATPPSPAPGVAWGARAQQGGPRHG